MSSSRRRTCRRSVPGTRRNRWSRTACAYRWRAQPRRTLAARPARVESREDPPHRRRPSEVPSTVGRRSEEHTSELQSLAYLVCRLLLEKKKKKKRTTSHFTYEN